MIELPQSVQFLKGAGPRRAERLGVLGIGTVGDLLWHLPRDHVDRSTISNVAALTPGCRATCVVDVTGVTTRPNRRGRQDFRARLTDASGSVDAVWFNRAYLQKTVKQGAKLMVSGEVRVFNGLQFQNPEFEVMTADDTAYLNTGRIVPIYPLTAGVTQRMMRAWVHQALEAPGVGEPDPLPGGVRDAAGVMTLVEALRNIHFPDSWEARRSARYRIAFEELFLFQLLLLAQKRVNDARSGIAFPASGTLSRAVARSLPFALTGAQRRTLIEIRDDMRRARPMNRLVLGDVGSGKTVVALLAGCLAIESEYQVALLAPTEILAEQHAATLGTFLSGRVPVRLLTGRTKTAARRLVHSAAASAEPGFFVGTHALLEDQVRFARLGLVVVDEQHRFGVRQRASLMKKGTFPDVLVMTATPIPRTLSMTRFADLDQSFLDEKPADRPVVETHVSTPGQRDAVYARVRRELDAGCRAYVVFPLVSESEKLDLSAATEAATRLRHEPRFRGVDVGLLHGKMKGADKHQVMEAFREGRTPLLVSTTVIEVGVDVPEATVMLIEHPERYGLSQLHQLRGRIGRGTRASALFLMVSGTPSKEARERLGVLVRCSSGFDVAAEDLKLRGPGEFLGTRQHGAPALRFAHLIDETVLLSKARRAADSFLSDRPRLDGPEGMRVRDALRARFGATERFYGVA